MSRTPDDREPSALPLGGYWLGMLFTGVPALLASGMVYSVALPRNSASPSTDGILTIAMSTLPLIGMAAYYRSARRYGYAASPALVIVVVLLIWAGAAVGGFLNSFEDLSLAHAAPEQLLAVRRLSEAVIWGSAALATVNAASATAVHLTGTAGHAARITFLVTASLWGALILVPALAGMLA